MKVLKFAIAATLLAAPATSYGAILGVINGDGADAVVQGDATPAPVDGGTGVATQGGFTLKIGRQSGQNDTAGRNAVYVFQLPSLGAIADPFTTASLSFHTGSTDANTAVNADLYGLAPRDALADVEVVAADYYLGDDSESEYDTTDATLLEDNILTPAGPTNSLVSTSAQGSGALVSFLNAQYASGAGAGEFVYLRLSPDGAMGGNGGAAARGYNVHTANDPDEAKRPTIAFEAIPEPSSVALLAVAGAALACLRRRR